MSKRHRLQNYLQKTFEVTIDGIDARGWGQGRFEDESGRAVAVEVRGALPGDVVLAQGRHIEKSVLQAAIVEMRKQGYPRVPSSCPHSAVRCNKDTGCGGCSLRECAYETQCRIKYDLLSSMLRRQSIGAEPKPVVPCVQRTQYRNKMELSFGPNGADETAVGLHPSGFSYEVIEMQYCDLLSPLLSEVAQKTTAWARRHGLSYYRFRNDSGFLRLLTLRMGKRTSEAMLFLTTSSDAVVGLEDGSTMDARDVVAGYRKEVLDCLSAPVSTFYWCVVHAQKGRQTQIEDRLVFGSPVLHEQMYMPDAAHALSYEILPHAFFQPNTIQAEKLYQIVLGLAEQHMTPQTPVLDLYCGTGTIALSFALYGHRAIAVDIEKQAIENARENARKNGLEDRIEFYAGDTGEILKTLLDSHRSFEDFLLVVDPPRRGLLPTAYRQIMRIRPKTLVYVSCNPESLAEDLKKFTSDGYGIETVQPVDMLPQTAHLETVCLLVDGKKQ